MHLTGGQRAIWRRCCQTGRRRATGCDGAVLVRPVVRATFGGSPPHGVPYENSYAWIMRLDGGEVVDGTAFFDSISFDDVWAPVQP